MGGTIAAVAGLQLGGGGGSPVPAGVSGAWVLPCGGALGRGCSVLEPCGWRRGASAVCTALGQ